MTDEEQLYLGFVHGDNRNNRYWKPLAKYSCAHGETTLTSFEENQLEELQEEMGGCDNILLVKSEDVSIEKPFPYNVAVNELVICMLDGNLESVDNLSQTKITKKKLKDLNKPYCIRGAEAGIFALTAQEDCTEKITKYLASKGIPTDFIQKSELKGFITTERTEDLYCEEEKFTSFCTDCPIVVHISFKDYASKAMASAIKSVRPGYTHNEIMNIAICLTQSFLTVFSGTPGCGKTSICNHFADMLKLKEDKSFVQISVGQGWTSKRDFLGYKNPFRADSAESAEEYEGGSSEVRQMMIYDEAHPRPDRMQLVLLDEANLSPMEYYWSDFMGLCDDWKNKPINIGGSTPLRVPEQMRFAATINNDQTTEPLSPRLIDRAWIITLPKPAKRADLFQRESKAVPLDLSWAPMKELFDAEIAEKDAEIFDHASIQGILKVFEEMHPISPRTYRAMARYYKVAICVFEGSEDEKALAAMDFMISQKLLPQINGVGTYADWIKKLRDAKDAKAENLWKVFPRSKAILVEIIERGEANMDCYSFFS